MAPTWPITVAIAMGVPAPTTTTTAREADMNAKQTTRTRRVPIRKADAEPEAPIPVYSDKGKLVGIIRDPSKLTRVAKPGASDVDLTPAPSGEVGLPASDVAKLRKVMLTGETSAERDAAAELLHATAISKMQQIHRHPRTGR